MLIESNKLKTISNYAADKDITRQHVYRLIKGNEINSLNIDGVLFVIMDEKAKNFEKKRS